MNELGQSAAKSDPWIQARKFVNHFGHISATFTTSIRALIGDTENYTAFSKTPYSTLASYEIGRLLNSPTLLSHIYHAALTFRPEQLKTVLPGTPVQVAKVFEPQELAALLAIVYCYRRVQRRADKETLPLVWGDFQIALDVAMPLGEAIPTIGPVRALLVTASRAISWGIFAVKEPELVKRYMNSLRKSEGPCDFAREQKDFGTTYAHVTSTLIQLFGFGVDFANDFYKGITHPIVEELSVNERRFRVAQIWIDALARGDVPHETLGDDYELSDTAMDTLVERVKSLREKGSAHNWISKNRSDISAEKTPELIFDHNRLSKGRKKSAMKEQAAEEEADEG